MQVRLTNIALPVEASESELQSQIARRLNVAAGDIQSWRVLRKSLDARHWKQLQFVYSVSAVLPERPSAQPLPSHATEWQAQDFVDATPGEQPLEHRPVIVGSGPAGLLAGHYLAKKGYRPLILERGQAVKERVPAIRSFERGGPHDPENNYLFGEGGAGCFSDGKLTCRITGPDVDWVLDRFVECGGPESLTYEHRPHLGSNKLPLICRNFRRKIEALGGEYRFGCRLDGLEFQDGRLSGLQTSSGQIAASVVILAIGHSARDTYATLHQLGLPLRPKAFQLGLRIEHPQGLINRHKYGRDEYLQLLGAADYSLVAKGKRDLFTFCMCAGGVVIPSVSEPNMFCSNGMSNSRRDSPFGNSGLVVTLDPKHFGSDHALAGVELQRKYESAAFNLTRGTYHAPIQSATDFLARRSARVGEELPSSYARGTQPADLREVLPPVVCESIRNGLPIMDQKWKGKYLPGATLVGPEMRGSSPVRIDRDRESFQVPGMPGIYPVGEGAGYAGGIVTAAVDGLRAARQLVATFAAPR